MKSWATGSPSAARASLIEVVSEAEARTLIPQHDDFKALYPDAREDAEYLERAMAHIAAEKRFEIRSP